MNHLRKFFGLSRADRGLLARALLLVAMTRVGLHLLPFSTLRRLLDRISKRPADPLHRGRTSPQQIVWAVKAAGRQLPWASTCLTEALTGQVLLHRQGYPATLHIGVAKGPISQFQAHAWLESDGKTVLGGARTSGQYAPLARLHDHSS